MPKRGLARHWRIEASRFGAKGGSRCCELSRMRGCAAAVLLLRAWASQHRFYCVSRSTFGSWLLAPHGTCLSGARVSVALAVPNLAFRSAGSNFSRRIGLGFPGMRRSCHSRPPLGGWRRMWRACAQEVCKPDNSRRAGHAKVANARRCRTNAISAAIILQV